jgi:hypothetical protein
MFLLLHLIPVAKYLCPHLQRTDQAQHARRTQQAPIHRTAYCGTPRITTRDPKILHVCFPAHQPATRLLCEVLHVASGAVGPTLERRKEVGIRKRCAQLGKHHVTLGLWNFLIHDREQVIGELLLELLIVFAAGA